MAKKVSYYESLRAELGGLVEQLQLPELHKAALKRRWLDQVVWADKKADQSRRWHYRLRLTTIVGGVILPALVGINFQLGKANPTLRTWFPYFPFFLSQVIAVSAAVEEFCRFGDRWRDYRQMSENLKAEGWQYLQSSGSYQGTRDHESGYALFASRVESIIKDDVQNYISELVKQQSKQDQAAAEALESANTVARDRTLFAQPGYTQSGTQPGTQPGYAQPGSPYGAVPAYGSAPTYPSATGYPGMPGFAQPVATPVALMSPPAAIAGAAAILTTRQGTQFKLSTQDSNTLPDAHKIAISAGSALAVLAYAPADNNHIHITFAQAIGSENRNTWFVYAPHVELITANGQPINLTPTPPPGYGQVGYAQPAPVSSSGEIRLSVPYFSQRDNMEEAFRTCNTSSCAMAAKFLGAQISGDDQYYHYVIKHGDTTDHNAQTQALTELGIHSTWHTNLDFADLDKSLASGLPIVIGILHRGTLDNPTGGHMIVVVGRNASGDYLINDPFGNLMDDYASENGNGLVYTRQVLGRRWTPDGSGTGWGRLFYGNSSAAPAQPAQAHMPLQRLGMQMPSAVQTQLMTNGGMTGVATALGIPLSSTYAKDDPGLRSHLAEALKYKSLIETAIAGCTWLSPSIIAGIGSRESGWGLLLNPPGPSGTGDSGHGRGVLQIDDEGHPEFVSTGKWADPAASLRYAVDQILKPYYDYLSDKTPLKGNELLRAAISAYNAGPGRVTDAIRDGLDPDHYTTGGDYGKDVLSRAGFFQLNGWA